MGRGKVFRRKEHFVKHLKGVHKNLSAIKSDQHRFTAKPKYPAQCKFCINYQFQDWRDRIQHLSIHLEAGDNFLFPRLKSIKTEACHLQKDLGSDIVRHKSGQTIVELPDESIDYSNEDEYVPLSNPPEIFKETTLKIRSSQAFDDFHLNKPSDCEKALAADGQEKNKDILPQTTPASKHHGNRTTTGFAKQYLSSWTLKPAVAVINIFKDVVRKDNRERVVGG